MLRVFFIVSFRIKVALNSANTKPNFFDDDTLFKGQRGPMSVPSVHRLVKTWCRQINLQENYGSHTLRKTFGYHQRVTYG